MKKHFKIFLILFVFCLSFTLCESLPESFAAVSAEGEQVVVEISTAEELENLVNNYPDYPNSTASNKKDSSKAKIVLNNSIDMSGKSLTRTIGTAEKPFQGIFDGRGYVISNLSIDATNVDNNEGVDSTQYAGLFGYTKNATIKNLGINNVTLTVSGLLTNYVGAFVGRAENTEIQLCKLTGNVELNSNFYGITSFGGLVGTAVDSRIENCISKPNFQTGWNLNNSDSKTFYYGGLVGNLINSKAIFDVISTNIAVSTTASFDGSLYVGGVCGAVSRIGSEISNIGMSNTISCTDNSLSGDVLCGEILGVIANPVPDSSIQAISNIHYVSNSNVNLFGDVGDYIFTVSNTHDNILPSSITTLSKEFFTSANNSWHPLYGNFDFAKIWYGEESVLLQPFYGDFSVRISTNLHTNIFSSKSTLESAYRYGDSVSMTFAFNEVGEDQSEESAEATENKPLYSVFYDLTSITRNSNEVSRVTQNENGEYILSDSGNISISTSNDGSFTLTIGSINMATDGIYNIIEKAKNFNLSVTSKGFDKDNEGTETERVGETPAWVYALGSQTKRNILANEIMYYGKPSQNSTYITEVKSNEPYAFAGWWIDKDGEDDVRLDTTGQTLAIRFGQGEFVSDINIYAKWVYNACTVTFLFDEGIEKIELSSGRKTISTTGDSVDISKGETSFKMDIYVKKDKSFDTGEFINDLNTYKTTDPTKQFCTLKDTIIVGDLKCYKFELDLTSLNTVDFENSFSVKANTTVETKSQTPWLWIGIGIGGGVLVIAGLIVLIVVLKRRNGFGGGFGGGGSFKRNSYKGYY